jgi:hypothetical protein
MALCNFSRDYWLFVALVWRNVKFFTHFFWVFFVVENIGFVWFWVLKIQLRALHWLGKCSIS